MAALELAIGANAEAAGRDQEDIRISCTTSVPRGIWNSFAGSAKTPFSTKLWAKTWIDAHHSTTDQTASVMYGTSALGQPLFLLPLLKNRIGPLNILEPPGWKHSAYQTGLFTETCELHAGAKPQASIWKHVARAVPGVDAIVMRGVPQSDLLASHSLYQGLTFASAEPALRMHLPADWETVYNSKTTSKTRSNDRRHERRLAEMGSFSFVAASTVAARRAFTSQLLEQKSAQLCHDGLPNPFEAESVRQFYLRLAEDETAYVSALVLDGKPIALNFGMIHGEDFHGMVMSMAPGSALQYGPGRVLMRRTIEDLSRKAIRTIDFGVGAHEYKEAWADEEIERRDVLIPLSIKGRLYTSAMRQFLTAKGGLKTNPVLWKQFSRYRRFFAC